MPGYSSATAWLARRSVDSLTSNGTNRRNRPPAPKKRGRPAEYGELVRPLPRRYRDQEIAATPPDFEEVWVENGCLLRAQFFFDLVPRDRKPGGPSFAVVVLWDPPYREPLLVIRLPPLRLVRANPAPPRLRP